MATGSAVEVRKSSDSKVWYDGIIVDVAGGDQGEIRVRFEDNLWSEQKFAAKDVRRKPGKVDNNWNPAVGEEVEVSLDATQDCPSGWAIATIKNIKHTFYFVTLPTGQDRAAFPGHEVIVEKDKIRPMTATASYDVSGVKKESYSVDKALASWVSSSDAVGCLEHIAQQAGLLHINTDPKISTKILLVGEASALKRAKMLLDVHMKHQSQIQNFQENRDKQLKALEYKRNRLEERGAANAQFEIDPTLVSRIIGKAGETIRALQERFAVDIRVIDEYAESGEEKKIVRISGKTQEDVDAARAEVEFIERHMPVDDQMIGWILGKQGKTINDIKRSSGLVYARLDRDAAHLELCGTRQVVEDAVAMFETHIMYFGVFREMDEEMARIHGELSDLGDYEGYEGTGRWQHDSWSYETHHESYSWGGKGKKGKEGKGDDKGKGKGKAQAQIADAKKHDSWNNWEYDDWKSKDDWKHGKDGDWKDWKDGGKKKEEKGHGDKKEEKGKGGKKGEWKKKPDQEEDYDSGKKWSKEEKDEGNKKWSKKEDKDHKAASSSGDDYQQSGSKGGKDKEKDGKDGGKDGSKAKGKNKGSKTKDDNEESARTVSLKDDKDESIEKRKAAKGKSKGKK